MGIKEKIKAFVPRIKKIWIGIGILVIIFISLLVVLCSKGNSQKNKISSGETAVNTAPVEEGKTITGTNSSSGAATEAELPDLAEAIGRFSKETSDTDPDRKAFVEDFWRWIFGEAGIPEQLARKVADSALESPAFVMELLVVLQQDPYTYYLVDKQHPLPDGYEPEDLIPLKTGIYRVSRNNLMLRKPAADALQEMAEAAAKDGIVFEIGSTYRSAEYQAQVYDREVKTYGKETADRESAPPGRSQHQLGLVIDFAPIDDSFSATPASRWLQKNADSFGFSLSFPDGYEDITGYRWESWHYRYVGKDLAAFIDNYFDGTQQYALQFIHAWQQQAEQQ
ncbi:MAG: M15 family metallopeptidase [Treponema sp.]|nr:M15 family metallopeptidase [Treponema sp.]